MDNSHDVMVEKSTSFQDIYACFCIIILITYFSVTIIAGIVNRVAVNNFDAAHAEITDYQELSHLWYEEHDFMPYPGTSSAFFAPGLGLLACFLEMICVLVAALIWGIASFIKRLIIRAH